MATVRKAQSVEHNFQLVVTRVFEEGEEDILDDEEESAFRNLWRLLTRHLILFRRFRTGFSRWRGVRIPRRLPGRPTDSCVERPAGGIDETYEFVATGANDATIELFAQCMYRAMYERKHRRSSDAASPNDLQEFVVK